MTSWKNEKRALKRAEEDAAYIAREQEQNRRDALSMWERIEEFVQDEELKNILHILTEKAGLES